MKKWMIFLLCVLLVGICLHGETFAATTPDGRYEIYVKKLYEPDWLKYHGTWQPGDYDEIWIKDLEMGEERLLITNNFDEMGTLADYTQYLGSFGSLHISPDGKKLYFLCQNCTVDAVLYVANIDGMNVRRIHNAHQLDLVGGEQDDEYFGYLVVGHRESIPEKILWQVLLLDPDGNKVLEIDDVDEFWTKHVLKKE